MAIRCEDECVGCPSELGCLGDACIYRNVPHLYCDRCECEYEELYVLGDEQVCEDCLKDNFETVTL